MNNLPTGLTPFDVANPLDVPFPRPGSLQSAETFSPLERQPKSRLSLSYLDATILPPPNVIMGHRQTVQRINYFQIPDGAVAARITGASGSFAYSFIPSNDMLYDVNYSVDTEPNTPVSVSYISREIGSTDVFDLAGIAMIGTNSFSGGDTFVEFWFSDQFR